MLKNIDIKPFTPSIFLPPEKLELFPWLEGSKLLNIDKQKIELQMEKRDTNTIETGRAKLIKDYTVRSIIWGIRLIFISTHPIFATLLYHNKIIKVFSDFSLFRWEDLKLNFKLRKLIPSEYNKAINLFNSGLKDEAIRTLNNLDANIEQVDNYESRIKILETKARLEYGMGLFLSAAISFINAATVASSASTRTNLNNETGKISYISKKAEFYFCALIMIRSYIKLYGVNDDFKNIINQIADKAIKFAELESKYRGRGGIHRIGGFIDLKMFKLPKISFSDKESARMNEAIAISVQKIQKEILNQYYLENPQKYLEEMLYKDNDSTEVLIESLDDVEKYANDIQKEKLKEALPIFQRFYKYANNVVEKNKHTHLRPFLELSEMRIISAAGEWGENELLRLIDIIDKERNNEELFLTSIIQADCISCNLSQKTRKQFAKIILEKEYELLGDYQIKYFERVSGIFNNDAPFELRAVYPQDVAEFKKTLDELEIRDYIITGDSHPFKIEPSYFKKLIILRSLYYLKKEDILPIIAKIDLSTLSNIKYHDWIKEQLKDSREPHGDIEYLAKEIKEKLPDLTVIDRIIGRLNNINIKIGVFGVIKSGKSTFINALLKRKILFGTKNIATNMATNIKTGTSDIAVIKFINGEIKEITIDEVKYFTAEQYNTGNEKNVSGVDIYLQEYLMPKSIEIVDMPGLGVHKATHQFHNLIIEEMLDSVDAVAFITTPEDGLKNYEVDFIKKVTNEKKLPFLLVINKIDLHEKEELDDIIDSIKEKLALNSIDLANIGLIQVSALMGFAEIPEVQENELCGLSREEAIIISNITQARKMFKDISIKVELMRRSSILDRMIIELEIYINKKNNALKIVAETLETKKQKIGQDVEKVEKLLNASDKENEFKIMMEDILNRFDHLNDYEIIKNTLNRFPPEIPTTIKEDFDSIFKVIRKEYEKERDTCIFAQKEEIELAVDGEIENLKSIAKEHFDFMECEKYTVDESPLRNKYDDKFTANAKHILSKILAWTKIINYPFENIARHILNYLKENDRAKYHIEMQNKYDKFILTRNKLIEELVNCRKILSFSEKERVEANFNYQKHIDIAYKSKDKLIKIRGESNA